MQLSEQQQKTVAAALTILAGLVILAAGLGVLWILGTFMRSFAHVFLPLVVACIASLIAQPYYDWLRERLNLPIPLAIAALFLSVLVPLGLFIAFFGSLIAHEVTDLLNAIPAWWQRVLDELERSGPEYRTFLTEHPAGKKLVQVLEGQGPMLAAALGHFATITFQAGSSVAGWVGSLLSWAVAPVYFVFFLIMKQKSAEQLEGYLPFLKTETRRDVVFLVNEFVTIIVAFFRGQLIIAFLQGLLFAVGFSLIGLRYGIVLGLLLGFLNIIPYLGSMLGLAITLPLAYFQADGGLATLIGVLVVLTIVQAIEGYFLTPKIMGDRTGLHPMAIIFAVFFWGSALGGIFGMILAIPLTAFLVVFWRLAKEKYIRELV